MSRIKKIKQHVVEHKEAYIAGSIGLVIGGIGTLLLVQNKKSVEISMSRIFSPGDNNLMKVFINPLGDPGNVVQCLETSTVYASQGQAARELGVDPSTISRHLNGLFPDVKGQHLTILGKAGQPIAA